MDSSNIQIIQVFSICDASKKATPLFSFSYKKYNRERRRVIFKFFTRGRGNKIEKQESAN